MDPKEITVRYIINGGIERKLTLIDAGTGTNVEGDVLNQGDYSHKWDEIICMANKKLKDSFPDKIITYSLFGRNYRVA